MMRDDEERDQGSDPAFDRRVWRQCWVTDAPEDAAAHFLDFAAFAEGRLDEEEQDRIAALLAADPDAAADVRAATAIGGADRRYAGLDRVVMRATGIFPDPVPGGGRVVALGPRPRRPLAQVFAQWGSIAAAIAVAGWLGFAMGSDASLALSGPRQPSDSGFLPELFDPATGFLRDLGEGLRT